jgi:DNA mismatch endonuclease (patch repair protein)
MSGIRGKNTRPELLIRRQLHALGYRFRLHVRTLPGTPDLVLPRYRAAVNVHGCFWHGHDCRLFKQPSDNRAFWRSKLDGNRTRDRVSEAALARAGWRTATVWECSLRGADRLGGYEVRDLLARWLTSDTDSIVIRGRPASRSSKDEAN